jgi:uncharacterized protein involved in cysteine biosynthesis
LYAFAYRKVKKTTALRKAVILPILFADHHVIANDLYNKQEGSMDEGQGQGPAWIVFLVWVLVPLLIFFLALTFTG